jgi:hypothetical protein
MQYTSTFFTIPPDLAARLPIPGGWDNVGGLTHITNPTQRSDSVVVSIPGPSAYLVRTHIGMT